MATTTNYGWVTPDDTDLVKDGAAAIRTLGSSVDTSFVDLLGGTTGQVLTKASNTDLDFTFAAPASGGMTLLSTTSMSGVATVTVSSISQSFNEIQIWVDDMKSTDNNVNFRVNGSTSSIYGKNTLGSNNAGVGALADKITQITQIQDATSPSTIRVTCKGYTDATEPKVIVSNSMSKATVNGATFNQAIFINIGAINSITLFTDGALNFTAGSIRIWGVK